MPDNISLAICHPKLVVVVRWPAAICSAWLGGLAAKYSPGGPKYTISDWPHHCHPQGYTQAEDDVIEQAYASQMSITRRIPSQPAHPLRWEHEKPGKDRGDRSVEDGAERRRRRVRHNQ